MKAVIFVVLLTVCSTGFATSPLIGYVQGITLEAMYVDTYPYPLCEAGRLYTYSLDINGYMYLGMFVLKTTAYDNFGNVVEGQQYSQIVTKTTSYIGNGLGFIGRWSADDGMKRKGDDTAIIYPDNDGVSYTVLGGLMYGDPLQADNECSYIYQIRCPNFDSDIIELRTWFNRYRNFTFFRQYLGSAWCSMVGALNGIWTAWEETEYNNCAMASIQSENMVFGDSAISNDIWPTKMMRVDVNSLDFEAVNNLESYTVSFNADDGSVIPIFLVGHDPNGVAVKTFCSAKKVDGVYVSDNFFPTKSKVRQVYTDPNNGTTYRTAYNKSATVGMDIELIRLQDFFSHWLEAGGDYDLNGDGRVNMLDYAILTRNMN